MEILNPTIYYSIINLRAPYPVKKELHFVILDFLLFFGKTKIQTISFIWLIHLQVLEKSIALRGGTPSYQAPESLQGEFSGKEDQYALARILEEILKANKHNLIYRSDIKNNKDILVYLDEQIIYVQKNFLCYKSIERPVIDDIRYFGGKMRDKLLKIEPTLWQKIKDF